MGFDRVYLEFSNSHGFSLDIEGFKRDLVVPGRCHVMLQGFRGKLNDFTVILKVLKGF